MNQQSQIVCQSAAGYVIRVCWKTAQHNEPSMTLVDYDWSTGNQIGNSVDGTHVADAVPIGGTLSAGPPPPAQTADFEGEVGYVEGSDPVVWVQRVRELKSDDTYDIGPWLLFDTTTPYTGGGQIVPGGGAVGSSGGSGQTSQLDYEIAEVVDGSGALLSPREFVWIGFDLDDDGNKVSVAYELGTALVYTLPAGHQFWPAMGVAGSPDQPDPQISQYHWQADSSAAGVSVDDVLLQTVLVDPANPSVPVFSWYNLTTQAFVSVPPADLRVANGSAVVAPPLQLATPAEVLVNLDASTPETVLSLVGAPADAIGARIAVVGGGFIRFRTDQVPDSASEMALGVLYLGRTPVQNAPVEELARTKLFGGGLGAQIKVTYYVQ